MINQHHHCHPFYSLIIRFTCFLQDEETDTQLKKIKELSKAELAAAIAKEKSSQIEKIAEADLNV